MTSLFLEHASLDFPSCITMLPSLDHRPHIWKKGISNSCQTRILPKSCLWCTFSV